MKCQGINFYGRISGYSLRADVSWEVVLGNFVRGMSRVGLSGVGVLFPMQDYKSVCVVAVI